MTFKYETGYMNGLGWWIFVHALNSDKKGGYLHTDLFLHSITSKAVDLKITYPGYFKTELEAKRAFEEYEKLQQTH